MAPSVLCITALLLAAYLPTTFSVRPVQDATITAGSAPAPPVWADAYTVRCVLNIAAGAPALRPLSQLASLTSMLSGQVEFIVSMPHFYLTQPQGLRYVRLRALGTGTSHTDSPVRAPACSVCVTGPGTLTGRNVHYLQHSCQGLV